MEGLNGFICIVVLYYMEHYKHMPGQLTRASLVCEKALFEFSKITLKQQLLGKGDNRGQNKTVNCSHAFEELIAAIYLLALFQNIYLTSCLMELFSMITSFNTEFREILRRE